MSITSFNSGTGQAVKITIDVQDVTGGAVVEEVIAQLGAIGPAAQIAGAQATASMAGIEVGANKARAALTGLSMAWKGVMPQSAGTAGTSTAFQSIFMGGGASGQWSTFASAAQTATKEASDGLDHVGKHALTSLDNVRLLRDDLGVRIPRSMEKAIANSALLSGAIGSIGTGLLAIGAVDIFIRLAEGAHQFYEKFLDVNAAQREFMANQQKARDSDFVNVHSIETARLRLDEATTAAKSLQEIADKSSNVSWGDRLSSIAPWKLGENMNRAATAMSASEMAAQKRQQVLDITREQNSLEHQLNVKLIEAAHAGDSILKGQALITAEKRQHLEIDKENARFAGIEDKQHSNRGLIGRQMQAADDMAAEGQAAAKSIELARQERDQIIQIQNEAVNAGLEGNALRAAQEQQEIDAITRKFRDGEMSKQAFAAETAAVQQKFANQAMMLQQQLDEQTRKMADEASQAGMKGNPLVTAQMWSKLQEIDATEQKAVGAGGFEPDAMLKDYESQRASVRAEANAKMAASDEQFAERVRQLTDSSDAYQLQGYARIEAEARKHLETLQKDYEDQYGKDESKWAGYEAAKSQIADSANRQREQLHERTMAQITKEEQQAARMGLPDWQQAQQAIIDVYNDRVTQIQRDVQQHVMTEEEGARAVRAAWATEQAQMQRDAQQTRDRLATTLGDFFSDPAKYIQKRAMDTAFQVMANDMMAYFQKSGAGSGMMQWLFGMGPQMSTSTNPMTDIKSVLGIGGSGTASAGITLNTAGTQLMTAGNIQLTAANTLLAASSTLQSAAATLSFGGGGGGFSLSGLNLPGLGGSGSSDIAGGPGGGGGAGMGPFGGPDMVAGGAAGDYSTTIGTGAMSSTANQVGGLSSVGGKAGQIMGAAGGALTAGFGIYNAYENSDPLGGMVSGAIGGAEIGALGGPVGMAIGAVVGGLAGLFAGIFGDHGQGKAKDYDKNTVQPGLAKYMKDYEAGRGGYNQVARELDQLQAQAKSQTTGWGSGARSWYGSHIAPEIAAAVTSIQRQERGGRSRITMSAAQYHTGGWVGGFGDLSTGPGEGFAKLLDSEFVVHSMAARSHGPLLEAVNSGNVSYARQVQPRMPAAGSGVNVTLVVKALDAKDVAQWAKAGGGRALVSAINQSQRQYSGVGRG